MRHWHVTAAVAGLVLVAGGAALATGSLGTYLGYPEASVTVGGVPVTGDVPAIIVNGRTLVPLRFVAQALGATVTWDTGSATAQVQPNLIELVTAKSVTEPTSSPASTLAGTASAAGGPNNPSQSFSASSTTNGGIAAYALLWDDGASHTYEFKWTSSSGQLLKDDTVEMQPLTGAGGANLTAPASGPGLGWQLPQSLTGLPPEVALEDPFALNPPLSYNQTFLPGQGLYYVTLYRDGTPIAKAAFLVTS
jgi:hypothetical protein